MRTGDGYNHAYLSPIPATNITTPKCPCGYRTQTPTNLLLYCKNHQSERKKLQKTIKPPPLTWRIAMFTTKGLKASLTFLEETGIATCAWLRGSKDLECDGRGRHGNDEAGGNPEEGGRREERAEQVESEERTRNGARERGGMG